MVDDATNEVWGISSKQKRPGSNDVFEGWVREPGLLRKALCGPGQHLPV